jgi:hypothetical protein
MIKPCFSLVLLLATVVGCGSADDEAAVGKSLGKSPRYPLPGCEDIDPAPCDVRITSCQTRLLALAACLRGEEPGELPPISRMSEAQYTAYLNDLLAEMDPPPDPNHYERALTMLGLVAPQAFSPETVVSEQAEFIAGQYRWKTKDILLVEHGERFDERVSSPVLVHEFIHLLQDRDVDLMAFEEEYATTHDSYLASDSVIEGEARMHESRYRASMLGLNPATIDWERRFQSTLESDETWIVKQPSPHTASWQVFPYEWGARYIHLIWQAGGLQKVLGKFAAPPTASQVLMASDHEAADMSFTPGNLSAPIPPAEWTLLYHDPIVLGAWDTFLALAKQTTLDKARTLALAWRSDQLWIYGGALPAAPSTAVVWCIDFADEVTAATVATVGAGVVGEAGVRQQGVRVVLAKTDALLPLDWAFAPEPGTDGGTPTDAGSVDGSQDAGWVDRIDDDGSTVDQDSAEAVFTPDGPAAP